LKNGKDFHLLDYPEKGYKGIGVNRSYTTTFCNWGMYKVADIINNNKVNIKHSFVHILEKDISILRLYLLSKEQ
jgi:hypothetical protein